MEPTISLTKTDETVLTFLHCLRTNNKYKTQKPITYVDYFAQLDLINTSKQLRLNHQQIINACDVVFPADLQTQKIATPYYLKTKDSVTVLAQTCYEKLHQLFVNKIPLNYVTRFRYEFQILRTKGFLNYFLLVADYVQYAKQKNIYVGPGRGSVAGSLIAYLLGITMIDPLSYNLIFERFLNPSRNDMPDIDIDFEDVQRSDIFLYLQAKYGMQYVANISTFQNIGFKMAVRDVFRVFDYPITIADKITKLIASVDNFHFTEALAHNKLLSDYKRHYEEAFQIIERIIGFPRQTGTHAAGIIIADRSLNNYIPVRHGANNVIQSQYGMNYLKSFGLIKMDILGLRNLTLLKEMIKVIAQKENIHYDLETLDRDDQKTFTLLRKGDTLGLFQLESPGMTRLLLKMQVVSLNDLSAVLALYRPGAMQNIDRYLQARKKGFHPKTRLERVIAQISGDTYGFLIYQEQIMMLASVIAQFDLAKADHLRKAMSKKDHALILSLKKDFYTQGVTNGYNKQELDYS